MAPDLQDRIRELRREGGLSRSQIHAWLLQNRPDLERVPHPQTIGNLIRGIPAPSDPWSLLHADPATARVTLDVLALVVAESRRAVTGLSRPRAEMIDRIAKVAPDLRPGEVLHLVHAYERAADHDQPTTALDAFLAFSPWRSPEAWQEWIEAVNRAPVLRPPMEAQLIVTHWRQERGEDSGWSGLIDGYYVGTYPPVGGQAQEEN